MEIIKKIAKMREKIRLEKSRENSIGFVPTMGYLHAGHLSLVQSAEDNDDCTVVSIFVNPTQFGPDEDYESYPRDLKLDSQKLAEKGVDYLFVPEVEDFYPRGYNTFVEVKKLTENLCGSARPGHFRGVTTVLTKFFNIIQPNRAYFGKKDFQQLVVVKRLVEDLNYLIEIVGVDIVRENDGLAKSSRNKLLNPKTRAEAVVLNQSLKEAEKLIREEGIKDADYLKQLISDKINSKQSLEVDYAALVDPDTLEDIEEIRDKVLIALAVFTEKTRLIDNRLIEL
ncbi:MAG: pantoate--beta-alanine ligase [Halanaerobium sp. MDAL1]|jgi:pantoate--beta-alanine ligase|nr:MAG: pantoate--beta-alanine ligase [Halanaerobium sp. T82-1]OEG62299.1 MAG: pantoate--beta-alanine ligase [Halanaerobium sp. MDAL1]OEG62484.1 MAG: pantoate--beta-alanine ligase [Halanaerobium sp. MDAL1]